MTSGALIGMLAALVAAGTGLLLLRGATRLNGSLLIVSGAALMSSLVRPPTGSLGFTLSILQVPLASVTVAAAGAAWPVTPVSHRERLAVLGVVAVVWTVGGLVPTLLFDPVQAGCFDCPANLLLVRSNSSVAAELRLATAGLALVWAPVLVTWAVRRWRRAPALTRRHSWPMVTGGVVAALAAVGAGARALTLPVRDADPVGTVAWWLVCACVLLIASGVAGRAYLVRTAGRRMARTVLAAISDPGSVVASLRRTVGDDSIDVVFLRDDGRAIDLDRHAAPIPPTVATVRLSRDHAPFAEVRFDPRLAGSSDLIRTAVTSASLTLEHLAAQARLRAAIAEHTALRARIVAEGDAERRRLERNLHDGAQQQLVALGIMLASDPSADHARAHDEIDLALRELREVARGVYPVSLAEDGIEDSLRELGDHTRCHLMVASSLDQPISADAASAIYQLVRDVAAAVPAGGSVHVSLDRGASQRIHAHVTARPPVPDPESVVLPASDRFAVTDGRLKVASDGVTTRVEGDLPCVW